MPSLRSTRSRKVQEENIEIKENLPTKKEQAASGKKVVSKNSTRAGRASKESAAKVLKEVNTKKENSSKGLQSKRSQRTKMVNEEEIKKQQNDETPKNQNEEMKENAIMTEESSSSSSSSSSSDSSTDSNEEDNEECSPSKKQKMNDPEPKKAKENENVNKQTNEIEEKTAEPSQEDGGEEEEKEKTAINTKVTKTKSISLKSHHTTNKDDNEETSTAGSKLPKQLLTVISNLYLNVGERLHLDFPPRCLDDLEFCHRHHYRSELPEAPITSQAHSLRSALQHYRYVLFINATTDMCHRGEFPGKGIFTKVMELVLVSGFMGNYQAAKIIFISKIYIKCPTS